MRYRFECPDCCGHGACPHCGGAGGGGEPALNCCLCHGTAQCPRCQGEGTIPGVLVWDKPEQVMTEQRRRDEYSSSSEVPGTFVPNMSAADQASWKAKWVHKKTSCPQIEIRRNGLVVIVSLHGYKYKYYDSCGAKDPDEPYLHLATSGPQQWSWIEWDEFTIAVAEARQKLLDREQDDG